MVDYYDTNCYSSEFAYHEDSFNMELQDDGSYLHDDGEYFWYNEAGEIHREDGPAITNESDVLDLDSRSHSWCLNGEDLSFKEFLEVSPTSDEVKMMLRLQYDR